MATNILLNKGLMVKRNIYMFYRPRTEMAFLPLFVKPVFGLQIGNYFSGGFKVMINSILKWAYESI